MHPKLSHEVVVQLFGDKPVVFGLGLGEVSNVGHPVSQIEVHHYLNMLESVWSTPDSVEEKR